MKSVAVPPDPLSRPADDPAGDPNRTAHAQDESGSHGEGGAASARIVVAFGFWIFLLSDIVTFSCFFAAYAVMHGNLAGGPGPRQLFDLTTVRWETAALLASSFTCGIASFAAQSRQASLFNLAMLATAALGLAFLTLEGLEFGRLIAMGAGPDRSGFLSAFFALVGLHGLHVGLGLLWLATMIAQVWAKGFREDIGRRILCFALFWHALDIVWVGIFSVVYLMGTST